MTAKYDRLAPKREGPQSRSGTPHLTIFQNVKIFDYLKILEVVSTLLQCFPHLIRVKHPTHSTNSNNKRLTEIDTQSECGSDIIDTG